MTPYRDWLAFDVEGQAMPAGSKTRTKFGVRECGSPENIADKKAWRERAASCGTIARTHAGLDLIPVHVPIAVTFEFRIRRPKYHASRRGGLKPQYVDTMPTSDPDTTKLVRSIEDGLTGIVWADDAGIVWQQASKRYADLGEPTGCRVVVRVADGIASGCVGGVKSTVQAS